MLLRDALSILMGSEEWLLFYFSLVFVCDDYFILFYFFWVYNEKCGPKLMFLCYVQVSLLFSL